MRRATIVKSLSSSLCLPNAPRPSLWPPASASQHFFSTSTSSPSQYANHVPTSLFQKAALAFGSAALALRDPERADMVGVLGETTGALALRRMRSKMMQTEEGRQVLQERPRITSSTMNIPFLLSLPEGTFGRAYADFMSIHGFDPNDRPTVRFVDDEELAYIMTRYREMHDLVHALTGLPPTVASEVAVKWFEFRQTGLPMCLLSGIGGPLRIESAEEQRDFKQRLLPWAWRAGATSQFLMGRYLELPSYLERNVEDVRAELCLEAVPPAP